MKDFKPPLPEPLINQERFHYNIYGEITDQLPNLKGYTEAQLLAYRDACIEMCAKVCRDLHANDQTNILYAAKVIKELK